MWTEKKKSTGRNSAPSKVVRSREENKPDFGDKLKESVETGAIHTKRKVKITPRNPAYC